MGFDVVKYPRGILKIVQIGFSICAFAIVCAYHETLVLNVDCGPSQDASTVATQNRGNNPSSLAPKAIPDQIRDVHEFRIEVDYPAKVEKLEVNGTDCDDVSYALNLNDQTSSDLVFFVFTGVACMIYCAIAFMFYLFCDGTYKGHALLPSIDLIVHLVFILFWFAGSIALAVGIEQIQENLGLKEIIKSNPALCLPTRCSLEEPLDVSPLVAADVFGFLTIILFGSNLWFIYKETAYYASSAA